MQKLSEIFWAKKCFDGGVGLALSLYCKVITAPKETLVRRLLRLLLHEMFSAVWQWQLFNKTLF